MKVKKIVNEVKIIKNDRKERETRQINMKNKRENMRGVSKRAVKEIRREEFGKECD